MDNHHITRAMVAAAIQQGLIVPTLDSGALKAICPPTLGTPEAY